MGKSKLHFIGILGVGMCAIAELLVRRGYIISGSDLRMAEEYERLTGLGISVSIPHDAYLVDGSDLVVYSLAISEDNPEYIRASKLGIPLVSRAELLGCIMQDYGHRIGVSGTHGKSTTVAMLHRIFSAAGLNPTTVSGADIGDGGAACHIGGDEYFIYEACEYKDSFLRFSPTAVIINNIELDHTDYFADLRQICDSFGRAAALARDYRFISDEATGLLGDKGERDIIFGDGDDADYRLENLRLTPKGSIFSVSKGGESLGNFELMVLGRANALDALGAIAVAHTYGIEPKVIRDAICSFSGIGRRLQLLDIRDDRHIYYDYAHHPTEIFNTLSTLKAIFPELTVIFRPHTYSRTRDLFDGFCEALSLADYVVILPVYAARREMTAGADSSRLASAIHGGICLDEGEVIPYVREFTRGAIALMGAGEVDSVKNSLLKM